MAEPRTPADEMRRIKERLAAAEAELAETVHLPPGNDRRDDAVVEYKRVQAVAQEWGVA